MEGFSETTQTHSYVGSEQTLDDAVRSTLEKLGWEFNAVSGQLITGTTKTSMAAFK